MAILEKEVWVTLVSVNIKYYEEKGYDIPKHFNRYGKIVAKGFSNILVKVDDLPNRSSVKLTKICDICKKESNKKQPYQSIVKSRENGDGKDRCFNCAKIYSENNRRMNVNVPYERSLEYFCKNNNSRLLDDFLENNDIHPSDVFKSSSRKKYWFKCTRCDELKYTTPNNVTNHGFSCFKCGDGRSYPEKLLVNFLKQLGIDVIIQETFEWSKNIEFMGDKRYDFYIPSLNCIIETHGRQHYTDTTGNWESYEEIKKNDEFKEKLARTNGIENYIIIDCRKSNMDWIKNEIMSSELPKLLKFQEKDINWLECHEFACNSLVKIACDMWNHNVNSTAEIGNILQLSRGTIIGYLKRGFKMGWCDYDAKKASINSGKETANKRKKKVIQLNLEGLYLQEWDSATDAKEATGISGVVISRVCNGKQKKAGGFKWMFKEDYDKIQQEQALQQAN